MDGPNSYYVDGSKIVLIHDDEIAEYEFADPLHRSEQVGCSAGRFRKGMDDAVGDSCLVHAPISDRRLDRRLTTSR